jgi:hypothetical protein
LRGDFAFTQRVSGNSGHGCFHTLDATGFTASSQDSHFLF